MNLRPVDRWEWLDLIRRARLGRTTKLVAVMLALYANEDGSRAFPGIARLAVVCELGYNTVKDHLALLRKEGWIERVARTGARGRADEYRLTVRDGADVPTPARIDAAIERLRSGKGWGGRTQPRPGARAEVADHKEAPRPGSQAEVEADPAGTSARPTGHGDPTSARLTGTPRPAPRAPTNHVPRPTTTPDHPQPDLRTAVTATREAEAATNPESDEVGVQRPARPAGCPSHGPAFLPGVRPDGKPSCPLCRRGAHLARVIPLNRTQEAS